MKLKPMLKTRAIRHIPCKPAPAPATSMKRAPKRVKGAPESVQDAPRRVQDAPRV